MITSINSLCGNTWRNSHLTLKRKTEDCPLHRHLHATGWRHHLALKGVVAVDHAWRLAAAMARFMRSYWSASGSWSAAEVLVDDILTMYRLICGSHPVAASVLKDIKLQLFSVGSHVITSSIILVFCPGCLKTMPVPCVDGPLTVLKKVLENLMLHLNWTIHNAKKCFRGVKKVAFFPSKRTTHYWIKMFLWFVCNNTFETSLIELHFLNLQAGRKVFQNSH